MKCDECSSAVCKHIHALDGYETYAIDQFTIGVRPKWTPVENKLPEDHERVIVFDQELGVCMAYRRVDEWYYYLGGDSSFGVPLFHVTHWMPLPSTESITGVGEWTTFGI